MSLIKSILKSVLPQKVRKYFRNILVQIRQNNMKRSTLKLIPELKKLKSLNTPKYIVSLTSYGKRLKDTAPYAIISLFDQSILPDKIVLWVCYEDKNKIPKIMDKLVEKGLEIRFCEDLKSYKKLIPSLECFPDNIIITTDDDVYYSRNWFEELLNENKKNPRKIICYNFRGIKVDENNYPLHYMEWKAGITACPEDIFPIGIGGILYPPKCFYKDILNKSIFTALCPYADDIWFWAMAILNKKYFNYECPYIIKKRIDEIYIDRRQGTGKNSLWNYNIHNNNKQINALIDKYPQIREHLKKIIPSNIEKIDE